MALLSKVEYLARFDSRLRKDDAKEVKRQTLRLSKMIMLLN